MEVLGAKLPEKPLQDQQSKRPKRSALPDIRSAKEFPHVAVAYQQFTEFPMRWQVVCIRTGAGGG